MRIPIPIRKSIALLIILTTLSPLPSEDMYGEGIFHSLDELPSMQFDSTTMGSVESLLKDKYEYEKSPKDTEVTALPLLNSTGEYIIRETSELQDDIDGVKVSSSLLEKTLVRNARNAGTPIDTLSIRKASPDKEAKAKKRFYRDHRQDENNPRVKVLTFDFGVEGTHLIFSKPVELSIAADAIPEGSTVSLYVLHAGDLDFNTSGLMTRTDGSCQSDGTASYPASTAQVVGGKVTFYTCGASTFVLGYTPVIDLPNNIVYTTAVSSTGDLIIGGQFTTVGGVSMSGVARINSGGFLDLTFANPQVNNIVYASAVQSDGKILIGGAFTGVAGVTRNYLARLNVDGTLDTGFDAGITVVAGNAVRAITIQPDGKILIGGVFTTVGGVTRNRLARVSSTGGLDGVFNPNANNIVYTIALQSDGQILAGGTFTTMGGVARNRVARVSSTGGLDGVFNPNLNNTVFDIKIQSDSGIVLGGAFTTIGGVTRNRIARVSSTGGLDGVFNPNLNNTVQALTIEPSGNIIIGGALTTVGGVARNRIARVSSTGGLDGNFNPNASTTVWTLARRLDGSITIGGAFTTIFGVANTYLSYIDSANSILASSYNMRINNTVWTLTPYSTDGKVIIGGAFTTVGGVTRTRVARVNTGGALDITFADPNVNNIVYASAIQSDGKILIGGAFTGVTGVTRNYLARLNTDGTLDTGFDAGITVVAANAVRAITIQSDGKILIGGIFTTVGGVTRNRIARLNTDGTLDTTFNANANSNVYSIAVQSDGKILLGGVFTTMGGVARNDIARVSSTGGLDGTFNPNANGAVWDIEIQSNSSIVFGGQFTTIGGIARNRLARVSNTGGLDGGFNPNVNNTIQTITIDVNNNIIIGGALTTVGGVARNRLARVSSTGSLDTTFNPNANGIVYALDVDIENNLLAGGAFTTLGTKTIPYFSWIGLIVSDFVPPTITSTSLASGSLLPIGNTTITTGYQDAGVGIDTTSVDIALQNWSGGLWGDDVSATYLTGTTSITTSTGVWIFEGIPYGKYRYTVTVRDLRGNSSVVSNDFYIDEIEWNISQPSVDIGTLPSGITKTSSPDELILTIQTVGAPFRVTMSGTSLQYASSSIPHWTGTGGYGYEKYSSGYSGTLSSMAPSVSIASQTGAINVDGDKNIYTYRIQFGALVGSGQLIGGDYLSTLQFTLVTTY